MKAPTVSCIVPVYNGERYLREALDSILAQTYRPLEIIVVDDGSTDGTAEVAANYGNQVRYFRQDNMGPAAARNFGLRRAEGGFIAFLDADDLWHPEKLTRQMTRFQSRPELDLCVTHVQNFWVPELQKMAEHFQDHRFSRPLPGYGPPMLLARRSLFEAAGVFSTELRVAEDLDWFLRAVEKGAVVELLPEVLVYRRLHHTNISMEPGGGGMKSAAKNRLVQVVKASLDRRRLNDAVPQAYALPASDRRKEK